ncbi:MAG: hypothetical protein LBI13_07835 [Streptococcaceae bacterium]|jgi:hypothetical protein|nr:hypothetical protein [Streptococcaceae bacterium]
MKKLLIILSVLFMAVSLSACTNLGGKKMNSEQLTQKQSEEIQIKIAKALKKRYKNIETIKFSDGLSKTPWTDETGWFVASIEIKIDGEVYQGRRAGFGESTDEADFGYDSGDKQVPEKDKGDTLTSVRLITLDGSEIEI